MNRKKYPKSITRLWKNHSAQNILVFREKLFGRFCQIWQIKIVIFWKCADINGNDKDQQS